MSDAPFKILYIPIKIAFKKDALTHTHTKTEKGERKKKQKERMHQCAARRQNSEKNGDSNDERKRNYNG